MELAIEGYHWILEKPVVVTSLPRLVQRTMAEALAKAADSQRPQSRRGVRFINCGTSASSVYMEAVR
jgi:hypothetical protein